MNNQAALQSALERAMQMQALLRQATGNSASAPEAAAPASAPAAAPGSGGNILSAMQRASDMRQRLQTLSTQASSPTGSPFAQGAAQAALQGALIQALNANTNLGQLLSQMGLPQGMSLPNIAAQQPQPLQTIPAEPVPPPAPPPQADFFGGESPIPESLPPGDAREAATTFHQMALKYPLVRPFQIPGTRFLRVDCPGATWGTHYLVGLTAQGGTPTQFWLCVPGPYQLQPPPGLEGYRYMHLQDGRGGYWVRTKDL